MNVPEIKALLRAGRAVFTLQSARTGTHFTYRISQGEPQVGRRPPYVRPPYFVSVLIAPEVWGYLGVLACGAITDATWIVSATRATKVSEEAPSFKAVNWFLRQLARGCLPESLVFRHEGRCGRCARALTTPASVDTGLGPDCAEALGVPHEAQPRVMSGTFGEYDERGIYIADRPQGARLSRRLWLSCAPLAPATPTRRPTGLTATSELLHFYPSGPRHAAVLH
jgi:hypothetical protein